MEKTETMTYLPQSGANEFRKIMIGGGDLEERLTATYLRALKPDVFEGYKARREPIPPSEWQRVISAYRDLDPEKRADGWKEILKRFGSFIAKRDEVRAENASDEYFLKQMEKHFLANNMPSQAHQVKMRLYQFREIQEPIEL